MSLTFQQHCLLRWLVYFLAASFALSGVTNQPIFMLSGVILALIAGAVLARVQRRFAVMAIMFALTLCFCIGMFALLRITDAMLNGSYLPNSSVDLGTPIHAVLLVLSEVWVLSKIPVNDEPASQPTAPASQASAPEAATARTGATPTAASPAQGAMAAAGLVVSAGDSTATADAVQRAAVRPRGWRLPAQAPGPAAPAGFDASPARAEPVRLASGAPTATMRGAVVGQVVNVDQATLQSNQQSYPIVTLRLERNDPHAGRTFVSIMRLNGADAVGFAAVGDWVEAIGSRTSAHLRVRRGVNHTTGAVYANISGGGFTSLLGTIGVVIFVALFLFVAFQIFRVASNMPAGIKW